MKNIKLICALIISTLLSMSTLPGFCADRLKIGTGNFKSKTPIYLNTVGDSATISFGGTSGRRAGVATFVFQKLINEIAPGVEFDVTGTKGIDGKVSLFFSDTQISGRGVTMFLTSDDDSTATGKVKIISVEPNGDFSFSVDASYTNALSRTTNPLSGNFNGVDKRHPGIVKIIGTLKAVKP